MKKLRETLVPLLTDRWHPYFCILCAVLLLYAKSLAFRYVYLDDTDLVASLSGLSSLSDVFRSTPNTFETLYRPLLMLSFMLDRSLGGGLFIFHLTNILLHAFASCLVFLLLKKFMLRAGLALGLTLLFATHPVLTQAVAWIPGRNDTLLAVFALGSFICLVNYARLARVGDYAGHIVLFGMALMTKETAVVLPALGLLYFMLYKDRRTAKRQVIALAAGWLVAGLLWYGIRRSAHSLDVMSFREMLASLVASLPALVQYAGKMLFPFNLSVTPTIADTGFGAGAAALVLLGFYFMARVRDHESSTVLFGLAWMLLFLLPTLVLPHNLFFEHRSYLPLVGLMIAAAGSRHQGGRGSFSSDAAWLSGMVLLAFFSVMTFFQIDRFMNRVSFWKNAVATAPSLTEAHDNMGAIYQNQYGRLDLAEEEYKKAIQLNPSNSAAYLNYGTVRIEQGRLSDAAALFETALVLPDRHKDLASIYFNYGGVFYEEGKFADAETLWKKTIDTAPGFYEAYRNLAFLYEQQGKAGENSRCRALIAVRFGAGRAVMRPRTDRWVYARDGA
jgi:tetratricopeptide (TPR) repeat protein